MIDTADSHSNTHIADAQATATALQNMVNDGSNGRNNSSYSRGGVVDTSPC